MDFYKNFRIKNIFNYLKKKIKQITYKFYDWNNLRKSKNIEIINIETICLILGPYRNLTTLLSSILFLHPNCKVLNHASPRIHGNKNIDFLSSYSTKIIENFIRFSIEISSRGERGSYGGNITLSHAFESQIIKKLFKNSKNKLIKNSTIKSLIWKESLLNTNLIRSDGFNLDDLIKKEKKLKFILPIRNPLDCTISNMKTGHANIFEGINDKSTAFEVLEKVIDEIYWFILKKEQFPDRFFYFFGNDISKNLFIDISKFLKLKPDKIWISNAESGFIVKSKYKHDNDLVHYYKELINNRFYQFPLLIKKLGSFC